MTEDFDLSWLKVRVTPEPGAMQVPVEGKGNMEWGDENRNYKY